MGRWAGTGPGTAAGDAPCILARCPWGFETTREARATSLPTTPHVLGLPHRLTSHLHLAVVRVHLHSAGALVGVAGDKGLGWKGAPGSEDPAVDKFHGARLTTVHALVAPTSLDLSAYGD